MKTDRGTPIRTPVRKAILIAGSAEKQCVCVFHRNTHISDRADPAIGSKMQQCVMRICCILDQRRGYEGVGVASLRNVLNADLSLSNALCHSLHLKSINKLVRVVGRPVSGGTPSHGSKKQQIRITHFREQSRYFQ